MDANAALTDRLRRCVATGEFAALAAAYAEDALLDVSLPGERRKPSGPEGIVEALSSALPGPGRVVEWDASVHPEGIAVWLERIGEGGHALRQRHYLRAREGIVSRHWIYAARPHSAPPAEPLADAARELFTQLGPLAERTTLVSSGWSGNRIDRLVLADGRQLIAKRIVPGSDWLGRASEDPGREALLFADGVFARMPDAIDPAVVAAEREGEAWWVVMRDVSDALLDESTPLSRRENRHVLGVAAEMWTTFWDEEVPHLSTSRARLSFPTPATAEVERADVDLMPKQFEAAWEAFAEAADRDVAEQVLALVADVGPLADDLDAYGRTLVHGDLRDENIGFAGDGLVLLDFGLASHAHPALELAWYMCHDVWRIDATHDEVVEDFRRALGDRDDLGAVDLGLISGLVQYGWIFGHSAVVHPDPAERAWAREELAWWVPRVRLALERWR